MAFSLGALIVDFEARTGQFETDTGRAAAIMKKRADEIDRQVTRIARAFVVAAAAASAALLTIVKQAVDRADDLRNLALAFGSTTEEMSRLDYVAKQNNSSLEELTSGLSALQKNLVLTAEGSGRARKAVAELGVDAAKLTNLSLSKQMEVLAEAFAKVRNPAEKLRIAVQLFGDQVGLKMVPILSLGAAGIRELNDESDRLGNTLSTTTAEGLAKTDEMMKRFTASVTGLKTSLAVSLLPIIEAVGAALERMAAPKDFLIAQIFQDEVIKMERTMKAFNIEFEQGSDEAKRFAEVITKLDRFNNAMGPTNKRRGFFAPLTASAEEATKAIKLTKAELEEMERFLNQENQMSIDASRISQPLSAPPGEEMTMEINAALEKTQLRTIEMGTAFEETVSEMSVFAEQAARNIQDSLADFLFDPFDKGLKGMLRGFVDILRRMVAEAASANILKALGGGTGGIAGFFGKLLGGFGDGGGSVGGMASGGFMSAGMPKIVGERGPELWMPNTSGTITAAGKFGGVTIDARTHVDARGATTDFAKALPGILQEHERRLIDSMRDGKSRGFSV